ncbi:MULTISPECIES: FAD-binding oxidoreductase [unclassified Pseudonocardia]|uniref:FAD-binding oxidoreductase n=1 Tax=unclassified Pseudonocardia TaxID=2619320 RepID=UPI00076123B1|nr:MULTISPECIES: FAD-binding protein [unclassified Pseudonocardia]
MTTTTQSLHTALSARVTGRVVTGAAPGTCFQTGTAHRSEVTVAAGGPADVAAVLDVADRHGAPVTVHASGHGLRVPAAGGVLLDTSAMSGVGVDPATASARVGAGATWADVAAAAAPHGLRAPSGSAPSVGVAGYLSGGGLGLAVRSDGWAADHVRSIEVVDRDGVREVTGGEVFTRLRGTGPRSGEVVTAVTIGLLPADPLTGGGLVTVLGPADEPGDPAPLHAWASWTAGLPDAVTSGVSVVPYPDLPFLPPHLRGRRVLRVGVTVSGTTAEADRWLAPLRAAVGWDDDTVGPLDPVDSARVYAEPEFPHAYLGDCVLVDGLDPAALDRVATRTGPMAVTGIRHLGGAAGRAPRVPDSVRGRDAAYLVNALAPFGDGAVDPATARTEVTRILHPFTATGTHPAFRFGPA